MLTFFTLLWIGSLVSLYTLLLISSSQSYGKVGNFALLTYIITGVALIVANIQGN